MNRGPYSGSVKILLATLTVFASTVVLGQAPANASVSITYTIEANTPNVSIAYAPGQWQRYELRYSNLAGRYALGLNTSGNPAQDPLYCGKGPRPYPLSDSCRGSCCRGRQQPEQGDLPRRREVYSAPLSRADFRPLQVTTSSSRARDAAT